MGGVGDARGLPCGGVPYTPSAYLCGTAEIVVGLERGQGEGPEIHGDLSVVHLRGRLAKPYTAT